MRRSSRDDGAGAPHRVERSEGRAAAWGSSGLRVAGPAAGLEGRRGQSLVGVMAEVRLLEGHSQTPLGQWEQAPGRGTGQARRGQIIGVPCVTAALSRAVRWACRGAWQGGRRQHRRESG